MSVYFAIPTRGELNYQCAQAIRELGVELDAEPHFHVGHLNVAANRNKICAAFLASDSDVLYMLDDDVMPAVNAASLVDGLGERFQVVAAAVPVWRPQDPRPSFAAFGSDQQPVTDVPAGISGPSEPLARVKVSYVGTGCIAIKREVIEACEPPVFAVEIRNGLEVSEDVVFCERIAAQFRIGCDFRVRCDHWMKVSLRRVLAL